MAAKGPPKRRKYQGKGDQGVPLWIHMDLGGTHPRLLRRLARMVLVLQRRSETLGWVREQAREMERLNPGEIDDLGFLD